MHRIVYTIDSACDVFLQKNKDEVRIRIRGIDAADNVLSDFELEGSIPALRDLISTLNTIMTHAEAISEEMN